MGAWLMSSPLFCDFHNSAPAPTRLLELARSRAAAWEFAPPAGHATRDPDWIYTELISFVQGRLEIPGKAVCSGHKELFNSLDLTDTIITLSYDLVADNALADLPTATGKSRTERLNNIIGDVTYVGSEPASLLPEEREDGLYLKLHGSLDWLRCRTQGCRNNARFYRLRGGETSPTTDDPRPCRLCAAALRYSWFRQLHESRLKTSDG